MAERQGQGLRDGDRPVLAAGAADADGDVAPALADVAGGHRPHEVDHAVDELRRPLLAHDEVGDGDVLAAEVAQLGDPERVGQEPQVEDEVRVERDAVLEPERHQRHADLGPSPLGEDLGHLLGELVDVEPGGVDDHLRVGAQVLQQVALAHDSVEEPALPLQRVRAAHALEPAHQRLVGGVEEHQVGLPAALPQLGQRVAQVGEEAAGADIHDRRDARDRGGPLLGGRQLRQGDEQVGRDVVDDVPAGVLEDVGDGAAAGAAHTGDDDELGHRRCGLSVCLRHSAAPRCRP